MKAFSQQTAQGCWDDEISHAVFLCVTLRSLLCLRVQRNRAETCPSRAEKKTLPLEVEDGLKCSRFQSGIVKKQLLEPTGSRNDPQDLVTHICRLSTTHTYTHKFTGKSVQTSVKWRENWKCIIGLLASPVVISLSKSYLTLLIFKKKKKILINWNILKAEGLFNTLLEPAWNHWRSERKHRNVLLGHARTHVRTHACTHARMHAHWKLLIHAN